MSTDTAADTTPDGTVEHSLPRLQDAFVPFGWHLVLDLVDCDPDVIRSKERLCRFVTRLCEVIDMRPYGEPWAERFGLASPATAGFTVVQLIETSALTGHFVEDDNRAFLDLFSCKWFDPDKAIAFILDFFGATIAEQRLMQRG